MNDVLRRCRRTWRRLGVSSDAIASMTDELDGDLQSAEADGITAMSMVGGDPDGFARSWAASRGLIRPKWRVGSTTVVASLAMVPGAAMMLVVPLAVTSPWFIEIVNPDDAFPATRVGRGSYSTNYLDLPLWVVLALYGLAIAVGYTGALLATSAWLRRWSDPARLRTVRLLACTLPVGALAAGFAAQAYDDAWGRGRVDGQISLVNSWPIVFVVILVAVIAATRAWAVRVERRRLGSGPEPVLIATEGPGQAILRSDTL